MFRKDLLTIKRLTETKAEGEWSSIETLIYSNIPCHLSIRAMDDVAQSQSVGTLILDFQLFVDTVLKLDLEVNDIAYVKTSLGKEYELYVGEGFIYPLTAQYQLKRDKIV